jgi:hypothetical protein
MAGPYCLFRVSANLKEDCQDFGALAHLGLASVLQGDTPIKARAYYQDFLTP